MKRIFTTLVACSLFFCLSAQKATTVIIKNYGTLDYKQDVQVFNLNDSIPSSSEFIGTTKIGDSGFTTNCSWETVVETAKLEARKIGGNAIKITEHLPPNLASTCHRIKANILRVLNLDSIPIKTKKDSVIISSDYALLHIYRFSGVGAFIGYDLYLGDSVICRVSNKWKKTIKTRKDGLNTLWAKTEVKKELPVNFKMGHEYYIRCSITMGAFVGHPKLELMDNITGKAEYESLKNNKSAIRDLVTLNNGKEVECVITGEDNDNWIVDVFRNGKRIKTQIQKSQVKSIERGE
jgi:hypothetical protein